MQFYCDSLTKYCRLATVAVKAGDLIIGGGQPIRVQTMTTPDTMDTLATVEQSIRCIEAGAELIRITAPSKNEAENLLNIKNELRRRGYHTPLVADIHFTPNAAEIAARIVEKVRINPGNYADKKKFEFIDYTDADYQEEIDRIRDRFIPLLKICKEYGTAMRIGTNHGSLSDRIMSRYGDSPMGMVESAMEFLRIARAESYHNIVLSMKSSNPIVMVEAYRLLVRNMQDEFNLLYPLHIGVTEAGDGEDGRIKSAIGIGTLLEDGIGDTIRVSLTEDPEFEIPVCKDIVARYETSTGESKLPPLEKISYSPFEYKRRKTYSVANIGTPLVPVVVADVSRLQNIQPEDLEGVGYRYDAATDKWHIGDAAADLLYTASSKPAFELPGTLRILCDYAFWKKLKTDPAGETTYFPIGSIAEFQAFPKDDAVPFFIRVDASDPECYQLMNDPLALQRAVLCLNATGAHPMLAVRRLLAELMNRQIECPVIISIKSMENSIDAQLIHFAVEAGALFTDGFGDGIWLMNDPDGIRNTRVSGRAYLPVKNNTQFLNNTSFSVLQATRTRISKTEYISCPSCGRTLFDLQETTANIRARTHHLKGLKIAIMGCIVNGPGEMADADFGYVGSGPGKITLYKGKEVMKRGVNSDIAVDELINLLKENNEWIEP